MDDTRQWRLRLFANQEKVTGLMSFEDYNRSGPVTFKSKPFSWLYIDLLGRAKKGTLKGKGTVSLHYTFPTGNLLSMRVCKFINAQGRKNLLHGNIEHTIYLAGSKHPVLRVKESWDKGVCNTVSLFCLSMFFCCCLIISFSFQPCACV